MGKASFRVRIVGAAKSARRFFRGRRQMDRRMFEELDRLSGRTTRIMAGVAPKNTGRLAAKIHPDIIANGFQLVSDVKSDSGYSYTGVTRLGHRKAYIYPVRAQALRFVIGGKTIFAKRVRGYHPSRDWVETGIPAVEAQAEMSSRRVGRQIAASM